MTRAAGALPSIAALLLSAAGSVAQEVSFEKDLMPTIKRRCGACHITGEEPGKMALVPGKAYASLVNQASVEVPDMPRVMPGNPAASYLWHKLNGTHLSVGGSGVRMPMHQPPLPAAFLAKVSAWIEQGAEDN